MGSTSSLFGKWALHYFPFRYWRRKTFSEIHQVIFEYGVLCLVSYNIHCILRTSKFHTIRYINLKSNYSINILLSLIHFKTILSIFYGVFQVFKMHQLHQYTLMISTHIFCNLQEHIILNKIGCMYLPRELKYKFVVIQHTYNHLK